MIIGLDIGISSTKVVAFVDKKLNKTDIWENGFSKGLLQDFIISLSSIDSRVEKIAVTGVGSGRDIKTFVVIGRMTTLPHATEIFDRLNKLYGVNFILSNQSTHMTAIGAAIKTL